MVFGWINKYIVGINYPRESSNYNTQLNKIQKGIETYNPTEIKQGKQLSDNAFNAIYTPTKRCFKIIKKIEHHIKSYQFSDDKKAILKKEVESAYKIIEELYEKLNWYIENKKTNDLYELRKKFLDDLKFFKNRKKL